MFGSVTLLIALATHSAPRAARAQTSADLAARRVLLEQANEARQRGDHGRALDLAQRAQTLQSSPSLRLFVSNEQLALGRFVDAMATADICVREIDRDSSVPNRERVRAECSASMQRARAQVATVTLQLPSDAPAETTVRLDARVIHSVLIGAPIPADPGTITVEVSAPQCETATSTHTLASGATETITLPAPRCARSSNTANAAGNTPPPTRSAAGRAIDPEDEPEPRRERSTIPPQPQRASAPLSVGPFVVAGAGAVSFGLAGAFFALRNSAIAPCAPSGAEVLCPDDASLQRALQRAPEAQQWSAATTASLIVGTAAVTAGVLWLVIDRVTAQRARGERTANARPFVAPTHHGLLVGGAF